MSKKRNTLPLWHPTHWAAWMIVFVLYSISLLPMTTKQRLGEKVGKLTKRKLRSRYKVARKNVQACFPELNETEQEQLVEASFIACAKGVMETTHAWWGDVKPYVDNLIITGEEHLREAQSRGKGLLMIGGHYSIFDLALPLFAYQLYKPGYMYRPNDNPVIDRMIEKGRRRHAGIQGFAKHQLKEMVEYMKVGGSVWYACDQDFGKRCEVFVPFFGIEAGCITTPSWIARETGASILCVSHIRHPNGQYEITFSPIQEGFGEDLEQDARTWNQYLENAVRQYPDQYLWLHKRFKTRPEGAKAIY